MLADYVNNIPVERIILLLSLLKELVALEFLTDCMAQLYSADTKQWLLFGLFPVFLLLAGAEWWHYRGTEIYKLEDSLASASLGASYLVFELVLYALFVWSIYDWVYQFRLATIDIGPVSFCLLYLAVDFLFYVYHRTAHQVRWFWASHCVHHASEHMNFTTAMRQSALYPLAFVWAFFLPLSLIGYEREWIFFALAINLAYQFFLHTQWIDKLPQPVEWLFNTPSHHRVHHGRNPGYIDRNYGGTLIIFDRLLGTFTEEDPREKPEYGITRQVYSYNPVWLTLHEWLDMFGDMRKPGPVKLRLKHLWASPEWQRNQ
jgi:sterol desaturase/sphingolipid hydroxylase (fatty acid hydroxylase superfamily)